MFFYKYDVKQNNVLSLTAVVKMFPSSRGVGGGEGGEASASSESCLLSPGPGSSKRG